MKKIALVAGLVLAASVAVAPLAFAQDEPSAAVEAAICANTSVEAVSGAADVAASRAQRELDAAEAALPAVMAEQDRRAAVLADAETALAATPTSAALKKVRDDAKTANDEGNKARADADQRVTDAQTRLAATQLDQRNAVALEAQVATFVGTRSFDAVKTELCTTPAPPPPSFVDLDCGDFPLPDGRSAQAVLAADPSDPHNLDLDDDRVACEIDEPIDDGNDTDTDGDYTQVRELPTAIDTGRTL